MKQKWFIFNYSLLLIILILPYSRGCQPCAKDRVGKSLMPLFEQINTDPKMYGHFYTTEASIASGWKPQRFVDLPLYLSQGTYNKMVEADSKQAVIINHNVPTDATVIRLWTSDGKNNYSHSWEYNVNSYNVPMDLLKGTDNRLYATLVTRDSRECSSKLLVDGANTTGVAYSRTAAGKCIPFCNVLQCTINIDWNNACDKIHLSKNKPLETTKNGSQFDKLTTTPNGVGSSITTTTAEPSIKDEVNHSLPVSDDDGLTHQLFMIGCPVLGATVVIVAAIAVYKICQKRRQSTRREASKSTRSKDIQDVPLPTVPKDQSYDYENVYRANDYCEIEYAPRYITNQSRISNRPSSSKTSTETTLKNLQGVPAVAETEYESIYQETEYNKI